MAVHGSSLAVPVLLAVTMSFFVGYGSGSGSSSSSTSGLRYPVGDSIWSIPPTNFFYRNWSSSYSFHPGDSLLFEFESERYNVMQVSRAEYEACTADHPLKTLDEGPVEITLPEEGEYYYICSILNYCALGQKFSVSVHHESPSLSPAPLHMM